MAVLWLLWGNVGVGGAAPSATGQATAVITEPLNIQMTEELEFGKIRPGDTPGTVVVTPLDDRSATGGTELSGSGDHHHRAKFKIEGPLNAFFTIQLFSSPAEHDNGANPNLDITDLKSFSKTLNMETTTGQTDSNGKDKVYVGGTLQVPAGAKKGKYEGDVTITINF